MAKIVRYEVVTESHIVDLQKKVNSLLATGLQPFGNLVITKHTVASTAPGGKPQNVTIFHQVMIQEG